MKISILDKRENPNFGRTELRFEVDHGGGKTPSRIEVTSLVSANSKASEGLISIRSIRSIFGRAKSIGHANVYKKRTDLEKNEPKHILKRTEKSKEAPKEEAPAEAAPAEETPSEEGPKEEEKPSEEVKEEQPAEEIKEKAPAKEKGDSE